VFAHLFETGGLRRVRVRGLEEVRKRVLLQAAAFNLGLLMRRRFGVGTPRSLQGRARGAFLRPASESEGVFASPVRFLGAPEPVLGPLAGLGARFRLAPPCSLPYPSNHKSGRDRRLTARERISE